MIISGVQKHNGNVQKKIELYKDKLSPTKRDLLRKELLFRQQFLPQKETVIAKPGSISVSGVKSGTPAKEDVFEPNNTFGEAATLTAGTYQDLACNDEDWYKVNVPAGKYLQVKIMKQCLGWSVTWNFYDDTQTSLKELPYVVMDRTVVLGPLTAGDYYFQIFYKYTPGSLYDLEIQLNDATAYGGISGHVTNGSSSDIENVTVEAYDLEGNLQESNNTNSSGTYGITNLPAGDYKLFFNTSGATGDYAYEWYDNKNSYEEANSISVMAGFVSSNKDAQLADSGSIEGKVTDSLTANIENVEVRIYDAYESRIGSCLTDVNGDYQIKFLPAGNYKVEFKADSAGNYVDEWYNNQGSYEDADKVAVTAGSPTTLNVQLANGGIISGNVSNGTSGIENIQVDVREDNLNLVGRVYTDSNGDYQVTNIATGSYIMEFWSNGTNYVPEWYDNKILENSADPISVTAGSTTSGINAVLELGGSISGTLRNDLGFGLPNTSVAAANVDGNFVGGDFPYDTFGNFIIRGLPAGNYKIVTEPVYPNMVGGHNYVYEWYNNARTFNDAQQVSVSAGTEAKGIHIELSSNGGIIKGRITNGVSDGLQYWRTASFLYAEVGARMNSVVQISTYSDKNGYYELRGLPPGTYTTRARFSYIEDGYANQIYNGVHSYGLATTITVGLGSTVTGIDFMVPQSCAISGRVTDSFGAGLKGAYVAPFDATTNRYLGGHQVLTDKEGYYTMKRVRPGLTKIIFSASVVEGGQYGYEFYNNQSTIETATIIDVPAGGTMTGIDAVLSTGGGTISGYVKNPSGNPIMEADVMIHSSLETWVGWDRTDGNGYLEVKGLLPGTYTLYTWHYEDIFPWEWYSDKADYDSADSVVVTEVGTTSVHIVLGGPDHGITVTSPNGSEDWTLNTTKNITWTTFGFPKNLLIVLKQNSTNVALLGKNINPALGTFAWNVGDCLKGAVTTGNNFKIWLTDKNVQDKSDDFFSISDPFVTVTSPNGGENWQIGTTENITWDSAGFTGTLYLILQQDGVKVALIQKNIDPSLGTYSWTVGDCRTGVVVAGSNYKLLIKVKDSTIKDRSDAAFTIFH
jgi:protocatechuate 3,4-dioxygenase beta subunit